MNKIKPFLGRSKRIVFNSIERPAVILLYHRVAELISDPQLLSVAPGKFEEQVKILKKDCDLLTIDEFTKLLSEWKKMPKRPAIITFDDGYADNIQEAVPILESTNAQALFYITTSNIDSEREFWWDELERLFLSDIRLPANLQITFKQQLLQFDTSSYAARKETYNQLHLILKYSVSSERDKAIEDCRKVIGVTDQGRPTHRVMSSAEVLRMSNSPSAIVGSHTTNHPALSALSFEAQLEEVRSAKQVLEKLTGRSITHFSYPFGSKKDYNADSVTACKSLDFEMVCSNYYGQVHSWSNRFELPRILVRNWDGKTFRKNITKFFRY
jgi:peptidoglycan/xylan/chitin deacetylase (PgdA/CDA1 family)